MSISTEAGAVPAAVAAAPRASLWRRVLANASVRLGGSLLALMEEGRWPHLLSGWRQHVLESHLLPLLAHAPANIK